MFMKPNFRAPPRIEKWIMDLQDVDFQLIYEPGKDERDPLDFLSRHPLPTLGNDNTEKVICYTVQAENALVIDRIRDATRHDDQLQKLDQVIWKGTWELNRKDPDIQPFYSIRDELYTADGLILKGKQIIIPTTLQRKIVTTAHKMGHLGITKTKQMLRERYWFPGMNKLVETIVGQCFECQVTTKSHREEPVKMSEIPEKPWEVVSVDHGGPYPDGHYNLVIVDKRTRYPEVQVVSSTDCKSTVQVLKRVFATHGVPRRLESDRGPPFTSYQFAEFAATEGFEHHLVTPDHARANGEAEAFMKVLNKFEQICQLQRKTRDERNMALQELLISYRSTPHPATNVTPYKALMNRDVRIKIDYNDYTNIRSEIDNTIDMKDQSYKTKLQQNRTSQNTKTHNFVVGDYVIVKQSKRNKWSTAYEPSFYVIYKIEGSSIRARRLSDGREIYRDSSHFKLANNIVETSNHQATEEEEDPEWREKLFLEAPQDNMDNPSQENSREEERNDPTPAPTQSVRPKRQTRMPAYLQDYVRK